MRSGRGDVGPIQQNFFAAKNFYFVSYFYQTRYKCTQTLMFAKDKNGLKFKILEHT